MNVGAMDRLIGIFLLAAVLICLPHRAMGGDENLDDLLQGFEETDSGKNGAEAIDDLLQGFEKTGSVKNGAESDQPPAQIDELLDGFEETSAVSDPAPPETAWIPQWLSVDGYIKVGATWNFTHEQPGNWRAILKSKGIDLPPFSTIPARLKGVAGYLEYILDGNETDWRGLSRLRAELQTDLEAKFSNAWRAKISGKGSYDLAYTLNGRSGYTEDILDAYESELELREAWVLGKLTENLDVKLGRQIVVWGKSDTIRVTDVLNPLDLREPGMTDLEDIRLPLAMTRLDYYLGNWNISGIAVHEIRFNKNPAFGGDFYPSIIPPFNEAVPSDSADNTEFGLAINGFFSGWDIAFYYADFYQDSYHLKINGSRTLSPPDPVPSIKIPVVELYHERLDMLGSSFNMVSGSWLFKAEAAHFRGFEFFLDPWRRYSRTDVMAGTEYSGFKETVIALEAVWRHYHDFRDILECAPDYAQKNEVQWMFSVSRDFLNDRLNLTLRAFLFDTLGQDGAIERLTVTYALTDTVQLTGGFILYQSGDSFQYSNIGDNDRLYLELKYSF